MNFQNIAIDPGFGAFKAGAVFGETINTTALRSVVAAGNIKESYLNTGLNSKKVVSDNPLTVEFDGMSYLVGNNVHRYRDPVERLDFQRLSDGPELRALMYGTLWQLLGKGFHPYVNILIGLPVQVQNNKSLATTTRNSLRKWLVGKHRFMVNNEAVSIQVHQIKTFAQPLGTLFNWGEDITGQWTQQVLPTAKFAVADGGFNTFDPFVIENAQVLDRYSAGDNLGMRRACSFLKQSVRERYGVKISLHEADAYLHADTPVLSCAGGDFDLSPVCEMAVNDLYGALIGYLEEIWGDGLQFSRTFMVGGEMAFLRDRLLPSYPHAVIVPDAQLSNVIGLTKHAQRPALWK